MQSTVDVIGIEASKQRIKEALQPGRAVAVGRQSGKTTALTEWARAWVTEEDGRRLGFVSLNAHMRGLAVHEYRVRWPEIEHTSYRAAERSLQVIFVTADQLERLYGITREVVVDEWWLLTARQQHDLKRYFTILAAVGTLPAYTTISI